ncbi:Transcriptional regulator modE [Leclercia adecarboxylata]|uniref:Transcriptional regulator modE n=1 Tax=Leclercia adecarboxylata TaxID=83655 RepID=A0A4U9HMB0_9ENTR|nr:Transcriptional regulator modE [Leclercia adecarboxylata]
MQAEILLTLRLQQKLFADPRRIALLKQIAQTGSISQGAKNAGISYKSAWDAINEMNTLSEHPLVDRATGGKGGGGAILTRFGQRLIQLYDLLAQIQQESLRRPERRRCPAVRQPPWCYFAFLFADQRP